MAWTDPSGHVWTTGETVSAANMNTYIRLDLQETAPAIVTTAGDIVYADGANSLVRLAHAGQSYRLVSTSSALAWRQPAQDINMADGQSAGSTSQTSYSSGVTSASGSTTLPQVTRTTGTLAFVHLHARLSNDTTSEDIFMSYTVGGASSVSGSDAQAIQFNSTDTDDEIRVSGTFLQSLTAGSNIFTAVARVSGSSVGSIAGPRIVVDPI